MANKDTLQQYRGRFISEKELDRYAELNRLIFNEEDKRTKQQIAKESNKDMQWQLKNLVLERPRFLRSPSTSKAVEVLSMNDRQEHLQLDKKLNDWQDFLMLFQDSLFQCASDDESQRVGLIAKYNLHDVPLPIVVTETQIVPQTKLRNREIRKVILKTVEENGGTLKKRPLLAWLRHSYPDIKPNALNRQLNNLLKLKALDIARRFKTKPFVQQGKYFRVTLRDC